MGGWGPRGGCLWGAAAHGWVSPNLSSPMTLLSCDPNLLSFSPSSYPPPQACLPRSPLLWRRGDQVCLVVQPLLHPCWWRWLWWRARAHGGILSPAVVAVRLAEQRWQPASGGCSLASLRPQAGMTPPAHGEQKPG